MKSLLSVQLGTFVYRVPQFFTKFAAHPLLNAFQMPFPEREAFPLFRGGLSALRHQFKQIEK